MGKKAKGAGPQAEPEFRPEHLIGTTEWSREFQDAVGALTSEKLSDFTVENLDDVFRFDWPAIEKAMAETEAQLQGVFSLTDAEMGAQQQDTTGQNRGRSRSQRKVKDAQ